MRKADPASDLTSAGHSLGPPSRSGTIELVLPREDLLRFARWPGLTRRGPSRKAALVWYDNHQRTLAAEGLTLVRDGRRWRLEGLHPFRNADWPVAAPAPVRDEDASPPLDCAPAAAFAGRRRTYALPDAELQLLYGTLRSLAGEHWTCRLSLTGPAETLSGLAASMAVGLNIAVPRATLALEAITVAQGGPMPPRHLGSPAVRGDTMLTDGLSQVLNHLLDVLLYWTDRCRVATEAEAVHQARVATRRLRSALSIYKRATACPDLEALGADLRECAARLGAARDWDVFLDGTGARLAAGTPDPRITVLLGAAGRRRNETYAELRAYLASPRFRALEVALVCAATLRPWERTADPTILQQETASFAAQVLERRMKRVRKAGRRLADLPVAALHELRKDCKRLRYAAEFFAPGFAKPRAKAFIRRLAALQEELGAVNDTAVASALMRQLGRAGRGYGGGLVEGWANAAASPARRQSGKAWKKFRAEPPFWDA
ncbi:MAG: CHAD domain-containing protein [Acetobacteraceae bacterium]|nr:CHAD domain-containing protein [Acetobacteraceae bacterium]